MTLESKQVAVTFGGTSDHIQVIHETSGRMFDVTVPPWARLGSRVCLSLTDRGFLRYRERGIGICSFHETWVCQDEEYLNLRQLFKDGESVRFDIDAPDKTDLRECNGYEGDDGPDA